MRLTFLGAATTVTGSQYLLETKRAKVLVDCGMFQGSPHEVEHNRAEPPYDASRIDAMLLTHAHLDHCGLIPLAATRGLRGPIFATAGTTELAEIVLLDSAKLQEEFAQRHERRAAARAEGGQDSEEAGVEHHHGGEVRDPERAVIAQEPHGSRELDLPLYTVDDATRSLRLFRDIAYEKEIEVAPGVRATFFDAGHILGSSMIRIVASDGDGDERVIVFSGDIGRPDSPILRDPATFASADYVLMESTYGGREHDPREEAVAALAQAVTLTKESSGVLLVPSFAIGRTQEIVYELDRLLTAGRIPRLPLYLDSPMGSKATEVYRRHAEYYDEDARAALAKRDDPLTYPGQQVTNDAEQSKAIRSAKRPYMIVASNGMITGGRVLHHVRNLIDDPDATLLFVGYQGQGTLGALLQQGAKQVKLDGTTRDVRCRVRSISGFSAHADESELEAWIGAFAKDRRPTDAGFPRTVFIVHGDPEAEAALEPKVRALGFTTKVPQWRESVEL